MGIVQSSVTPELAIAGAVVAGSAAYSVYTRTTERNGSSKTSNAFNNEKDVDSAQESGSSRSGSLEEKKKGKGKNKGANKSVGAGASDADFEKVIADAKKKNEAAVVAAAAKETKTRASLDVVPGAFDQQGVVSTSEAEGTGKKARKKKAKKTVTIPAATTTATTALATSSSTIVNPPPVVPVPVESSESNEAPRAGKKDKKRKNAKAAVPASTTQPSTSAKSGGSSSVKASQNVESISSSQLLGMSVTLSDAQDDEDESWTRVSTRKKGGPSVKPTASTEGELLTSDTNITTSVTDQDNDNTEDESSVQELEDNKTFAEKMLPRPKKTGVEDMEDEPLQPTLSRVMRVKPAPGQKPAKGFSWGDYEDYNQDGTSADGDSDDAWEEVKSKKKKYDRSTLASSVDSVGKSAHPSTAPETLTKRQRQNANRYDAIKAEKDAQERDRLDRLADHKRELERVRISEQHAKGGKKVLSGGMQAVVEDGKLIWE